MVNNISPSSYNLTLSLNFTSIFRLPARLLARMRRSDDILAIAAENAKDLITASTLTSLQNAMIATPAPTPKPVLVSQPSQSLHSFPGPWAFFTSGYALGLFIMAVLLHRIQNVVVPPRSSLNQLATGSRSESELSYGRRLLCSLYSRVLPLDFSRTSTRLMFHLPTLFLLLRMLLLWSLILLQTASILDLPQVVPQGSAEIVNLGEHNPLGINNWWWLRRLGAWSSGLTMEQVCWRTFCSVCAAFCVEALVKGFDGAGVGLAAHMHANTSPFNLIGYAFLLHIYSAPLTHVNKFENLPSRPDKHVLITITIPLLQLTLFHILSIFKRWSHIRLLPTALSSFLSLLHFHLTLLSYLRARDSSSPPPPLSNSKATPKLRTSIPPHYQHHQPPYPSYPLLNFVPNFFETLLLVTTLLTISLNAVTQLLLTGSVDRPLVGLGLNSGPGSSNGGWSWSPPWEEDFSVLLLRVGTASLEATGLRGWANEVGAVIAPAAVTNPANGRNADNSVDYGSVGIGRLGVAWMQPGAPVPSNTSTLRRRNVGTHSRHGDPLPSARNHGLSNEVRSILSMPSSWTTHGTTPPSSSTSSWWVPGIGLGAGGIAGNWRWYSELIRFFQGVWAVTKGTLAFLWATVRGKKMERSGRGGDNVSDESSDANSDPQRRRDDRDAWEEEVYEKFLSGEVEGDDEDDEWEEGNVSSDTDDERPVGELFSRETSVDPGVEAMMLYSDWAFLGGNVSQRASTPSPFDVTASQNLHQSSPPSSAAPVLLAHMTHIGSSPMTRRAYDELVGASPSPSTPKLGRENRSSPENDETRRNCVICTVEARQIICWPCRCLALCDGCRECLASISSASKHRCPCCRRIVEGYSRIFIP